MNAPPQLREVNEGRQGRWWVLPHLAAWDALSKWERRRFAAMEALIDPDTVLYDVGVEFGWQSLIYGTYGGHGNMVLIEPSTRFWPGIRAQWSANNLRDPLALIQGFCGAEPSADLPESLGWPDCSNPRLEQTHTLDYKRIGYDDDVPTYTIDQIAAHLGRPPGAITIDVEGAEHLVLRGAVDTLMRYRPVVFCSVHPDLMERDFDFDVMDLHRDMADMGYSGRYIGRDHEDHWIWLPR